MGVVSIVCVNKYLTTHQNCPPYYRFQGASSSKDSKFTFIHCPNRPGIHFFLAFSPFFSDILNFKKRLGTNSIDKAGNMQPKTFTPFMEYIKNRPEAQPASSAAKFQTQAFNTGDVIFSEGARGYAAYTIQKGGVEISIREDGKKLILTTLGEDCVFGEMALILGNHVRTATVTAIEDTQVVRIPKEVFDTYMKESPKVISTCLVAIAGRLHEFTANSSNKPETLENIARILDLLRIHDRSELLYSETITALAGILLKEEKEIMAGLTTMENFNLIETETLPSGKSRITLLGNDRFLEKSLKLFKLLEGHGVNS
jgi:CRP-like cAMP-binding protein